MAYVTGTANSLADLLTAIQAACTANGWTLSAGGVLYKDTCYIEIKISGTSLAVQGGTGIDGSGNLTGRSEREAGQLCAPSTAATGIPASPTLTYPITYDISIQTSPDEVYVTINYAVNYYETVGFGQSAMPGLAGSGNWYCGAHAGNGAVLLTTGEMGHTTYGFYSLFCRYYQYPYAMCCGVDHALDGPSWTTVGAGWDWYPLAIRQPNAWNSEAILQPIRVYVNRPSSFMSPVLECAHARFVNVAALSPGQIITLGPDKWKVYPWWTKTTGYAMQNYGHAIRYDGP